MLKLTRRRGGIWYAGGTIKIGAKKRAVAEHSTGEGERAAAQEYVDQRAADLRHELLYGVARRPNLILFAQVGELYIDRAEGLHPNDVWRIGELNDVLGDCAVNIPPGGVPAEGVEDVRDGWERFKRERCAGLAPATVNRFRDTFQAALNFAAEALRYAAPQIARVKFSNERVRWLIIPDADRLVRAYVPHVQPIIRVYRYQGLRTQEALQLLWPNVNLKREEIFVERTKNGQPRTVNMHPSVAADLWTLWKKRGHPTAGHVFLNRLGDPYADTRDYKLPGGNPLRSAHATALAKAAVRPNGGPDFTLHDWRHHWASWMVMEGADLITVMRQGGWKDIRMVSRYAAVGDRHQAQAVARLK